MIARPIYLVMVLFIPLLCYAYFISLLNQGLPCKMPVAVVDLDQSFTSRLLTRQIGSTQQTMVVAGLNSYNEALLEMQRGAVYAFVVIPPDFQADVFAGSRPEVAFYTQNAYLVVGSLLMKDLTLTVASVAGGVNLKMRLARGQAVDDAMEQINPIANQVSEMGNAWTNYSVYLSTTMLPGLLQLIIIVVTVFSIGVELKQKTSRQWLLTADKSMLNALLGKLLPYSIMFVLLGILGNVILFDYLQFPFAGSKWQMTLGTVLFVLAQQALGVFIIGLVPSLRSALSVSAIFGTLSITFSGLTFPIEGMLRGIQSWSVVFPLRHYFLIYISQALTGAGMAASWASYLNMLVFLFLPLFVMIRLKKALIYQHYPLA